MRKLGVGPLVEEGRAGEMLHFLPKGNRAWLLEKISSRIASVWGKRDTANRQKPVEGNSIQLDVSNQVRELSQGWQNAGVFPTALKPDQEATEPDGFFFFFWWSCREEGLGFTPFLLFLFPPTLYGQNQIEKKK